MSVSTDFVRSAWEQYSIGPEFLASYLSTTFPTIDPASISNAADLHGEKQPEQMYVEFALSNVLRGRDARDRIFRRYSIPPHNDGSPRRYLDVGTAYGGFLVAFAEAGFETVGVEVDAQWAHLGVANCRDHKIPESVIREDFLTISLDSLGQFDVITCNDVIEHVSDPVETIRRIAHLLRPDGTAFFEIPNRRCMRFVERDGHYWQFGINLLDHFVAKEFLREATGDAYSCGEFYQQDWYLNLMARHGLDPVVLQDHLAGSFEMFPAELFRLVNAYAWWAKENSLKHSPLMREQVHLSFCRYQERLLSKYHGALENGNQRAFESEFMSTFWSIGAQRRNEDII